MCSFPDVTGSGGEVPFLATMLLLLLLLLLAGNVGLMAGAWATILAYEIYVRGILHSLASSKATNESVRGSSDHSHSLWSGQDFQSN